MDKEIIFSTSIITQEEKNETIFDLVKNELADSKQNKKGRIRSNKGGFQTEGIKKEVIDFLGFLSVNCLKKYYPLKNVGLRFGGYWINENLKHDYNSIHIHAHSMFSGIYYIDVPENSGRLIFNRNDLTCGYLNLEEFFNTTDSFVNHYMTPKKGLFVLFPSNLPHEVEANLSDNPRISIAFNLNIEHIK
tara:strand:+ start:114 stop:683 length:570 start_codon:yes stop_codon:yes gene_type:complete